MRNTLQLVALSACLISLFLFKVIASPQLPLCALYSLGFHGLTPFTVLRLRWLNKACQIAWMNMNRWVDARWTGSAGTTKNALLSPFKMNLYCPLRGFEMNHWGKHTDVKTTDKRRQSEWKLTNVEEQHVKVCPKPNIGNSRLSITELMFQAEHASFPHMHYCEQL